MPELQGFDDPVRLDAILTAVRWDAISEADMSSLQAPFRSGVEIEDYQLDSLVRAIQMPRVNPLVADDVAISRLLARLNQVASASDDACNGAGNEKSDAFLLYAGLYSL